MNSRIHSTGAIIEYGWPARSDSEGRALRIHDAAGELTLRNVTIASDIDDAYALYAKDPLGKLSNSYGDYRAKKPWNLDMENVKIVGSGTTDTAVRMERRHGSRWRNVCLDMPNVQTGVNLMAYSELDLQDVTVTAVDTHIRDRTSYFNQREVTTGRGCPDAVTGALAPE